MSSIRVPSGSARNTRSIPGDWRVPGKRVPPNATSFAATASTSST
jgi:hypothetical protein